MTIVTVLGIMLVLGLILAAVVDLRDRKRRPKKVPMPSRADLEGDARIAHEQRIASASGGLGGIPPGA